MKTCEFVIKVVPGSSRTAFCGMHDGIVKVKVAAPPEKGKANKALADYLAKVLAVKKKCGYDCLRADLPDQTYFG